MFLLNLHFRANTCCEKCICMVSKEKLCERIYLLEALIIAHSFSSFLLKIVYNKKFCGVKIL